MLSSQASWQTHLPWMLLFWICAALVTYAYVGYPALLWIVTRFKKAEPLPPSTAPSLTLLIAAHNEAVQIGRKLAESLALNYPKKKLQILVTSDGSTDETVAIVQSFACQGVELVIVPQQAGKTNAQNIAMRHAKGEIVVFSDATTEYHPDALRYLASAFADTSVGAVSGRYAYFDIKSSSVGEGSKAYAGYDNWLREMQSKTGSLTGCCGCIYAIRRKLYTPLAPDIISDFVEPLHVLLQGAKVKFEPRALAREDVGHKADKEFAMRVRVIARAWKGLASVRGILAPWKHPWISLQLISHKLLRYAVPLLLIGILLSSWALRDILAYRLVLMMELGFYGAALLAILFPALQKLRAFSLPMYFCVMNAAAFWGSVRFLCGKNYVTWKPQRESSHAA
jgi:glycosyltransferase involved in cell wall biosynthesis